MAWEGWMEFGGVEIINVDRTEAYAAGTSWFKPVYRNGNLAPMLGHGDRYTTPLLDDAPWVDGFTPVAEVAQGRFEQPEFIPGERNILQGEILGDFIRH